MSAAPQVRETVVRRPSSTTLLISVNGVPWRKFTVVHAKWAKPRPFQGRFVVRRLGLATTKLYTKLSSIVITCIESNAVTMDYIVFD